MGNALFGVQMTKTKKNTKKDKADKGKKAKPKSSGKFKAAAKPAANDDSDSHQSTLLWSCLLVEKLRRKPSIR